MIRPVYCDFLTLYLLDEPGKQVTLSALLLELKLSPIPIKSIAEVLTTSWYPGAGIKLSGQDSRELGFLNATWQSHVNNNVLQTSVTITTVQDTALKPHKVCR